MGEVTHSLVLCPLAILTDARPIAVPSEKVAISLWSPCMSSAQSVSLTWHMDYGYASHAHDRRGRLALVSTS